MENEVKEEKTNKYLSFLLGNRILLSATVVAIAAIVIGLISLFSMNSASEYQGMIKQVEQKTQTMTQNK